jgi:hypothetical protein
MAYKRTFDMSGDEADPWTSNDGSKENEAPGKMSKIFFINNKEYSALEKMREELRGLVADVDQAVEDNGWDAGAVREAIRGIRLYVNMFHKKYFGRLVLGLVKRDGSDETEFLLPEGVRNVSCI